MIRRRRRRRTGIKRRGDKRREKRNIWFSVGSFHLITHFPRQKRRMLKCGWGFAFSSLSLSLFLSPILPLGGSLGVKWRSSEPSEWSLLHFPIDTVTEFLVLTTAYFAGWRSREGISICWLSFHLLLFQDSFWFWFPWHYLGVKILSFFDARLLIDWNIFRRRGREGVGLMCLWVCGCARKDGWEFQFSARNCPLCSYFTTDYPNRSLVPCNNCISSEILRETTGGSFFSFFLFCCPYLKCLFQYSIFNGQWRRPSYTFQKLPLMSNQYRFEGAWYYATWPTFWHFDGTDGLIIDS